MACKQQKLHFMPAQLHNQLRVFTATRNRFDSCLQIRGPAKTLIIQLINSKTKHICNHITFSPFARRLLPVLDMVKQTFDGIIEPQKKPVFGDWSAQLQKLAKLFKICMG